MNEINRSLMVVKGKQPFLDWILSADDEPGSLGLEDVQNDASAYLVPEFETREHQDEILEWCWKFVFASELASWFVDEALWPPKLDREMFSEWFDVEFHSLVTDLIDDPPLEHIEFDSVYEADMDASSSNGDPNSNGH